MHIDAYKIVPGDNMRTTLDKRLVEVASALGVGYRLIKAD